MKLKLSMKSSYLLLPFAVLIWMCFACQNQKQANTEHKHDGESTSAPVPDTVKKSVPKEAHAQIGETHFVIRYHAPTVRGRVIWGGLVPYGEVWVTGAHSATSLEVDRQISINGITLPAGKYAFFTIPGKDKWTVIINKNWEQHLTDEYNPAEDLVRLDITPEILPNVQERLDYSIVDTGNLTVSIDMKWEKLKVSMPITL